VESGGEDGRKETPEVGSGRRSKEESKAGLVEGGRGSNWGSGLGG